MTRTIRIDDDVYEGLKKIADPFEDTPNTVIRKLLMRQGLIDKKPKVTLPSKSERKNITPQAVYEEWLVHILWKEFDGKTTKKEATKATIKAMQEMNILKDVDFKPVSTGDPRAENLIAWGMSNQKKQGFIKSNSPIGIWELTEKGIEKAKNFIPS